jgi:hypothetical protein
MKVSRRDRELALEAKFWRRHRLVKIIGTVKIGRVLFYDGEGAHLSSTKAAALVAKGFARAGRVLIESGFPKERKSDSTC